MKQTIEDILSKITAVDLTLSDAPLLASLSRQVDRNIALTNRQHDLAKEKIRIYADQLEELGMVDIEPSLNNLRMPLRQIDRSKTITIVDGDVDPELKALPNITGEWIKIRFPFNKKIIVLIDTIAKQRRNLYHHKNGSHSHHFVLHEDILEEVIDKFADRNFDIDPELLDMSTKIKEIREHKEDFIPGFYNGVLKNLRPTAEEFINNEVSTDDPNRATKMYDRRFRYGLAHVDADINDPLIGTILTRNTPAMKLNSVHWPVSEIASALSTLDRFPLLVLVDENQALAQVQAVHTAFANINNNLQSVLFRVKSRGGPDVNDYVRDNQLNNWVDKDTKIVYISKHKLPKVLLKSGWQPLCGLALTESRSQTHVGHFVADRVDLLISLTEENIGNKKHNEFV